MLPFCRLTNLVVSGPSALLPRCTICTFIFFSRHPPVCHIRDGCLTICLCRPTVCHSMPQCERASFLQQTRGWPNPTAVLKKSLLQTGCLGAIPNLNGACSPKRIPKTNTLQSVCKVWEKTSAAVGPRRTTSIHRLSRTSPSPAAEAGTKTIWRR